MSHEASAYVVLQLYQTLLSKYFSSLVKVDMFCITIWSPLGHRRAIPPHGGVAGGCPRNCSHFRASYWSIWLPHSDSFGPPISCRSVRMMEKLRFPLDPEYHSCAFWRALRGLVVVAPVLLKWIEVRSCFAIVQDLHDLQVELHWEKEPYFSE